MQTDEILISQEVSNNPDIGTFTEDETKEMSKSHSKESLLCTDRLDTLDETRELTDQESLAILKSDTFQSFLDQSSKTIERALFEDYDELKDYTRDFDLGESSRYDFIPLRSVFR